MAARTKLLDRLPVTGDILRGSLLTRTIRNHAKGCAKCASGEGHPFAVLTVSYPGSRTRQFSLRPERVGEARAGSPTIGSSRRRSKRFASSITICRVRTTSRRRAGGGGGPRHD